MPLAKKEDTEDSAGPGSLLIPQGLPGGPLKKKEGPGAPCRPPGKEGGTRGPLPALWEERTTRTYLHTPWKAFGCGSSRYYA